MVRGDLIELSRQYLRLGYTQEQIRQGLISQGYPVTDIDPALSEATSGAKKWVIYSGAALAIVVIIVASIYFIVPSAPTQLLDISLEPVKTTYKPGENADFIISLTNLGSGKRFDVDLKSELVQVSNNEVVSTKTETVAIETRNAVKSTIHVPTDASAGRYVVRTLASYGTQSARASFTLTISVGSGPVAPKIEIISSSNAECPGGCNDYDSCTIDRCAKGICVFDKIIPCCGNGICESGETESFCPEDCAFEKPSIIESITTIQEKAYSSAASDASGAVRLCKTLNQVSDQDQCFSGVAKRSGQADICSNILTDKPKDGCYLDFALARDRYDLCERVNDRWLKSSCYSYANLKQTGK